MVCGWGCWRNWQVTCDSWHTTYHIFYLIYFFVPFCQFLYGCYYPHTLRHSVSPVCRIFLMYLTHEPLLLGIMPTVQSCPKLPFYPTPWTPSSVAWHMLLNLYAPYLPAGKQSTNVNRPLNCWIVLLMHPLSIMWGPYDNISMFS